METAIKSLLILVLLTIPKISLGQNHPSEITFKKTEWHEVIGKEPSDKTHHLDKGHLETELEIYPFNIVLPADPVIKNEAMFDYHRYLKNDRLLNARFFGDANTHWGGKSRNMKDLIMYTDIQKLCMD